jgi:glutamyl-tRNA reductase
MYLHVVGIDYKNTPIELREKGAFSKSKIVGMKSSFQLMGINEYVVVSTCNRSEIYFLSTDDTYEPILEYYMTLLSTKDRSWFYAYSEEKVMKHLMRVTCGLESLVIGEDQILGQIKNSLDQAMDHQLSGKILNKLFRESISFSKKVKTTHKISENQTSVSTISIKFVEQALGSYKDKRVLVVGSGETGELVMKYLVDKDLASLSVINRTKCHAHRVTKQFNKIEVLDYEERYAYLQSYDAIFCATASPHMIFSKEEVANHLVHPVVFMDLAVPRDVDPAIAELEKASVYTVDDLRKISADNIALRQSLVNIIEEEIDQKVQNLVVWIKNSQLDVTIGQLSKLQRNHVDEALNAFDKKVKLEEKERAYLEIVMKSMTKKMFKNSVDTLKSLESEEDIDMYQTVMTDLFDLR